MTAWLFAIIATTAIALALAMLVDCVKNPENYAPTGEESDASS